MAYEPKDNTGALFKNDKGDNPKRPDYRGDALIDGRSFKLSAWIQKSKKDGSSYMSIKIEPKDEHPRQSQPSQAAPIPEEDEGFIPF